MAKNTYFEYNNNCSKIINNVRSWSSVLRWELLLLSDPSDSGINGPGAKMKCCISRDATWKKDKTKNLFSFNMVK